MDRATFERWYAECRQVTAQELGRRGWVSAPCPCPDPDCPGWQATCVPPDADAETRRRALSGMVGYASFGDTPPTNGAGAGGG